MSAEAELYAGLVAHTGLAALVADRVWPDAMPENGSLPGVVFTADTAAPERNLEGQALATLVRIKVIAWATTRTGAKQVGDAIVTALDAMGQPYETRAAGYDDAVDEFADIIEIDWWE